MIFRLPITCALLLAATLAAPSAAALSADDARGYYFAGFANYELADPARDSDNGRGFQLTIGRALGEHTALELSYLNQRRDRDLDGGGDYKHVLSLDYVRDFGLYRFQSTLLPDLKPYLLGSIGGVLEDVRGNTHLHPALNLGVGLLFPLRIGEWDWGWGLRTEAKGLVQYNDRQSEPADNAFLADVHFQIGLSIPLAWNPQRPVRLPPSRECQLSVVDPVTGRRDCLNDSDRDGVIDSRDQCPATPNGDRVDASGCSLEKGSDSDHDGVLDSDDQCAGTVLGLKVDAKGCAVEQTLSLQAVTFESDAAVLTGAATGVLDAVARTLNGQANIRLVIGGHTDDTASESYNLALSKQRAESVRQYLIAAGVDGARLGTEGHGELAPLVANDSDANRALNRRVDFTVVLDTAP